MNNLSLYDQNIVEHNLPEQKIKIEDSENKNFLSSMSTSNSLAMSCPVQYPMESQVIHLEGLHITLAPYAAKFLMLAIKDRIRHGRHFTFKCQNRALTFVSELVSGSAVTRSTPFGVLGYWTQVNTK